MKQLSCSNFFHAGSFNAAWLQMRSFKLQIRSLLVSNLKLIPAPETQCWGLKKTDYENLNEILHEYKYESIRHEMHYIIVGKSCNIHTSQGTGHRAQGTGHRAQGAGWSVERRAKRE